MEIPDRFIRILTKAGRVLTILRRRNPRLRFLLPHVLVRHFNRLDSYLSQMGARHGPVIHHSINRNVFHCCVHKTGSQWIKSLLSDMTTTRYSGLSHYHYQSRMLNGFDPRKITERSFNQPFPENTIVSPLYIDFENYLRVPGKAPRKAFFVMRDPRDIVVSAYFSARYSHMPSGDIPRLRCELKSLSMDEGMVHIMKYLHDIGVFPALRSWAFADKKDPGVLLVRYEDLRCSEFETIRTIFGHLDIAVPDSELRELIGSYSFKRVSGRDKGVENQRSHIRKGSSGDWRGYFDSSIMKTFEALTGDLVKQLGYPA